MLVDPRGVKPPYRVRTYTRKFHRCSAVRSAVGLAESPQLTRKLRYDKVNTLGMYIQYVSVYIHTVRMTLRYILHPTDYVIEIIRSLGSLEDYACILKEQGEHGGQ